MKPADDIEKLIKKINVTPRAEMDNRTLDDIFEAQEKSKKTQSAESGPTVWRIIMKRPITKFTVAAVIIIAVLVGIQLSGISIDGTSVAWAELVQRVEQSHNEYYTELLLAMEAKDTGKASSVADKLSEFWQGMGMLAEAKLDPTIQLQPENSLNLIREKTFYGNFEQQSDQQIFLEYANKFIEWLSEIENVAWANEIFHICRQLEEYAEEIREPGRHPELNLSYAEHCLPSFVTYCEWFEQLPWDNPIQSMTPAMLLTRIQRDLKIARREMETLELRGGIPFIKRCVQQSQKNVLDLDKKTKPGRTKKQRNLCRHLTRRIDELCALIIYRDMTRY